MKSVSGRFCSQCIFNLGTKNISSAEMQRGAGHAGGPSAAAWVSGLLSSLQRDVDGGSSLTLHLVISSFLFLCF